MEKPNKKLDNQVEKYLSIYGGVFTNEGVAYAATAEGDAVPVPDNVASAIASSLEMQDKIDTGLYHELEKKFAMINCRKTALLIGGHITSEEATDPDSEDLSGLAHLYTDVERIQSLGYEPVLDSFNDVNVETIFDEYEGPFPCIVHVFEVDTGSQLSQLVDKELSEGKFLEIETVKKMHLTHSFIVLGFDGYNYICFEKSGSSLSDQFEVVPLDRVGDLYFGEEGRTDVTFVGPLLEKPTNENA